MLNAVKPQLRRISALERNLKGTKGGRRRKEESDTDYGNT